VRLPAHVADGAPSTPPSTRLRAVPDARRHLSEGLVVEASVSARLLRVRLLVIDANLVIAPAQVKARAPTGRPAVAEPCQTRARAIGAGLAAAERCLSEGAATLARSRG
jgi:hypothetical protein